MKKSLACGCLVTLLYQSCLFGAGASQKPGNPFATKQKPYFDHKQTDKTSNSPRLDSRLQIGGNYTWVSIHPHEHTTFEGNLGGAQGMYEYRPMDRFYGGAKVTWRQGDTHGDAGKRSLLYIDAQERLGYTFSMCHNDFSLTLYSGLGYKHLGQKFDPKEGSSIKFRYNEFYIPVGMLTDYAANSWLSIGLGLTWMPQVYPTVSIVPLKGARWTLKSQLTNFYVEMPITFTLTSNQRFALIINPFYEYWKDGRSTAKTPSGIALDLPGNTYNFGGVELNFAYSF